jgi:hypothetical protein
VHPCGVESDRSEVKGEQRGHVHHVLKRVREHDGGNGYGSQRTGTG